MSPRSRPKPRETKLSPVAPPRQKSSLKESPVAPPAEPAINPPEERETPGPVEQTSPVESARPKARGSSQKYPHKVSFYQSQEDTERMRGAIIYTTPGEGPRSLSQFVHEAVMAEVERLEAKYNDGRPFPRVRARELPPGRPMGWNPNNT